MKFTNLIHGLHQIFPIKISSSERHLLKLFYIRNNRQSWIEIFFLIYASKFIPVNIEHRWPKTMFMNDNQYLGENFRFARYFRPFILEGCINYPFFNMGNLSVIRLSLLHPHSTFSYFLFWLFKYFSCSIFSFCQF